MTESVIDYFLLAFLGGVIGGGGFCYVFYTQLKSNYKKYRCAIQDVKTHVDLNKLNHDVLLMQVQVKALFGEFYQDRPEKHDEKNNHYDWP